MSQTKPKLNGHDQGEAVDTLLIGSPGALQGSTNLTLNTRQAQKLFVGRPVKMRDGKKVHPGIIGVRRFATIVRQVAMCARADDPYADQCLIQLDREFQSVSATMRRMNVDTRARLDAHPAIEVTVAVSIEPLVIPLHFQNQYAYRAAYLVADFDMLAAAALSAHHGALMHRWETEDLLKRARKLTRRIFSIPMRYHFSGATREDILKMTARGAKAVEKFGPIPDEILNRTVVPDYGAVRVSDGEPILEADDPGEEPEAAAVM